MARSVQYRREISDACSWHQDQALNSTIYILYQTGPTGFLLKEEDGDNKNLKVFLGDVHSCTCSVFKKEKDLCKHICWILLKKFRVPRTDSLSWQLGLNEREINQIIRGDTSLDHKSKHKILPKKLNVNDSNENNSNEVEQRPIGESDVCPICQDEFLSKKLPVSYCRCCGNNVHIKCMKVWADHQKSNGETQLKCPLCREVFNTFEQLDLEYRNNGLFKLEKQDLHYGLICSSCKSTPISGKCYKCTVCNELYLCQGCFNTDFHQQHSFVFREKITQKYHKANRDHVGLIPAAIAQNLATRDITEHDYELLLQLASNTNTNNNNVAFSQIPEKVIRSWPLEKVRENSILIGPGMQCRICLRSYQVNQSVRKLPNCKHKFHADCIDNWLIHSHPTCPIDGQVVWDPITAQLEKEEQKNQKSNSNSKNEIKTKEKEKKKQPDPPILDLMINFKHCVIENKKPFDDLIINDSKRFESAPSNKLKNIKIKDKRTSSIPNNTTNNFNINNKNLNINLSELDIPISTTKDLTIKPIIGLTRTQFPPIEVKGTNNLVSRPFLDNSSQLLINEFESNSILSRKNSIQLNDAFNLSSMLVNKPYQLSRFPTNGSSNSSVSSAKPSTSSESNQTDDVEEMKYVTDNLSNNNQQLSNEINENQTSLLNQFSINTNHLFLSNHTKMLTAKPPPAALNKQKLRVHHPPHFRKQNSNPLNTKKEKTNESITNNKPNELDILPMIVGIKPSNLTTTNSNDENIENLDSFY